MTGRTFTVKIGGEAGFGIMSSGITLSKIIARSGYWLFDYTEYPSIIRGGHNVMQVTFGKDPVRSQGIITNLLVALNQETIDRHVEELIEGSGVIIDSEKGMKFPQIERNVFVLDVPLDRLAREIGGTILMRNTAALGAVMAATGGDLNLLKQIISDEFGDKSRDIVENNHKVCEAGYAWVKEKYGTFCSEVLNPLPVVQPKVVMTGNEAIAVAAVAAGMQFASIYPMTPTSNILQVLAPWQAQYGFVYKQPEDEIAAINMAIGAAYAGARAMVATAGGGFCLMAEGYGLAGITETPVVMIEGMRGGPATGLPTWTEQGDLRFVLHAHQGDFPRIVLAPGDIEEAFHMTMQAFNLAEKYQCPVVVMVDKHVLESHMSVPTFNYEQYQIERGKLVRAESADSGEEYKRYAFTEDGISPRAFPGQGVHVLINSDEHNEEGYSDEDGENRFRQMNKRMKKLDICEMHDMPEPELFGPADAEVTIVSWGSSKGVVLDALHELPNVNYLHLTWMNPFPAAKVKQILERARYVIDLECNYSAQMAGLIAEKTGIRILDVLLKYDGRPFYVEEIVEHVRKIRG